MMKLSLLKKGQLKDKRIVLDDGDNNIEVISKGSKWKRESYNSN